MSSKYLGVPEPAIFILFIYHSRQNKPAFSLPFFFWSYMLHMHETSETRTLGICISLGLFFIRFIMI